MSANKKPTKPLMRSLGEFFGYIVKAVKTDPRPRKLEQDQSQRREVRRTVEEEQRGDMVLRRTTIEEVEIKRKDSANPS